jgi:hypothetical protein
MPCANFEEKITALADFAHDKLRERARNEIR